VYIYILLNVEAFCIVRAWRGQYNNSEAYTHAQCKAYGAQMNPRCSFSTPKRNEARWELQLSEKLKLSKNGNG
jgi:hypothetical protein